MIAVRRACLFFSVMTCLISTCFGQTIAQQSNSPGHEYFVDCSSRINGNGESSTSPWNSLQSFQAKVFSPGDVIQLRRGTECRGSLWPKGSGSTDYPIRLTAYGEGARPKVVAGTSAQETLRLFDQQYWDIDSLDLSGGTTYGIFVSGTKGILHHIHLSNLAVHDVFGGPMKNKDNGLVMFSPGSVDQHFDDVLLDGVTAWNTNQWVGIMIGGGNLGYPPESVWNTNAVIRNSTVHDVQGDGIVLFRVRGGSIDSSVAWNTGMQITQSIGTPNAIWTWMCDDCTVEGNEAYLTDSPGVDGGAFDIDYGNTKDSVIDNYGHDTQGYCVAIFGAGFVTRQSVVRGNLCINNGRSPRMANYQGAIFLLSWNDGSIDGLTMENNTVYWSPYENAPALLNQGNIKPGTAVFRNNTIYSTAPWMVDSNTSLSLAQNHYSYFGAGTPEWRYGTSRFTSLTAMQGDSHQETGSSLSQHVLQQWPRVYELNAELEQTKAASAVPREQQQIKGWVLSCLLPVSLDANGMMSDAALRQMVVLKSLSQQYRALGLQVKLRMTSPDAQLFKTEAFHNAVVDLDLAGITTEQDSGSGVEQTMLLMPGGKIVARWKGFTGPSTLGLALRRWMGEPNYSQMGVKADE
ncbi:right-handed parallel beta-helix repeat-containing protein [Edaphobacter paludis]|uniref:Right-handed parallel beta-helix repeat-containing protein n=1 Tax=Edaphobacter paludis TaxID=3035702 RepID=A0AAU7DB03_9BACT